MIQLPQPLEYWRTGPWRTRARYVRIDKVEADEVFYTFLDSDGTPGGSTSCGQTAFLRTYEPHHG